MLHYMLGGWSPLGSYYDRPSLYHSDQWASDPSTVTVSSEPQWGASEKKKALLCENDWV